MSYATNKLEEAGFHVVTGGDFLRGYDGERVEISQAPERLRPSISIGKKYALAIPPCGVIYAIRLTSKKRRGVEQLLGRAPFKKWQKISPKYDGGTIILRSGEVLGEEDEISPDTETLTGEELQRTMCK